MGFLGFLKFAFKLFDLLAWPLFGLGFPLYASIRAIENNSNPDMRNLVAYWIIISLNSLFELAFVKLIDWLLFWPYMKLMAVCWLVLPDFNGAYYVYDCLLRPCVSVDPHAFIKYLIKPKGYKSLIAENFLAEAERYVEENGSEALEKLLEQKSKQNKPDIDVEEIKAITNTEEKETAAAIQSKNREPNVAKEDARAVELPEKNLAGAATWGEPKGENPAVATEQVKCVGPNLAKNEKKTVAARETKEKAVAAAGLENKAKEITDSERVWSCALCPVTITCQENLESHFQGREHKAKYKGLTASKQVNENKGSSSSAASLAEPKNTLSVDRLNKTRTEKQEDKVQVNWANEQCKEKESKTKEPNVAKEDARAVELAEINPVATTWSKVEEPNVAKHDANAGEPKGGNPAVATEQVKCGQSNLAQNEKKTVGAGETKEKVVAAAGGENKAVEITDSEKVQRVWACALCPVTITCEKHLESHLQGRKHKVKYERLKASMQVNENNGSSSSAASPAKPKNTVSIDSLNGNRTEKQEDKVQVNWANEQCKEKEFKKKEPNVAMEDARAVELPEKNLVAATTWSKIEEPNIAEHNANAGEPKGENPAVVTEQVKCVEPNLAQNEKKTFVAGETKEKAVAAAGGENKAGEITDSEKVQRVLTCALCQVRIPCEKNFESHFQGRKHQAKWLKASKQENESKGPSSSAASPAEPKNTLSVNRPNETRTEKPEDKVHVNRATEQIKEKEVDNNGGGMNQSKLWCSICDVMLLSEIDLASHIGGKKHLKNTQQHLVNTLGGGFY